MAGRAPFFITGANCKIKVNGVTLAYATELSYSIAIPHARPKVLGVYEAASLEPLAYDVSGSFTIIKYVQGAVQRLRSHGMSAPNGAQDDGNGVGSWTPNRGTDFKNILANSLGKPADGRANQSLNPNLLQDAMMFDIEIYQKVINENKGPGIAILGTVGDKSFNTLISGNLIEAPSGPDVTGVARLRDCRITAASAAIQRKGVMTQTFQFAALYADEDSFIADPSGQGQQES